jgi:hypothetical protein
MGEDQMKTPELEWMLYVPMVFKILTDCEYLTRVQGIKFSLDGFTIRRSGGWQYAPSEILSFDDALSVLQGNGCAFAHWEAICILAGESFSRVLEKGPVLLARLFPGRQA